MIIGDTHLIPTNGPAAGDIRRTGLNLRPYRIAQTFWQVVVIELGRGITLVREQMMHDITVGWINHCLELKQHLCG